MIFENQKDNSGLIFKIKMRLSFVFIGFFRDISHQKMPNSKKNREGGASLL